jgi:hypothetical protein
MNFQRFIIFSFLFVLFSSYAYAATPTTKISEAGRGDYVLLTGEVVRFLDEDEFILRDDKALEIHSIVLLVWLELNILTTGSDCEQKIISFRESLPKNLPLPRL